MKFDRWAQLWNSLRGRVLVLVMLNVVALGVLASVASYYRAAQTAEELFDVQLQQTAQTLLAIVDHDNDKVLVEPVDAAGKYQHLLVFQVWELLEGGFALRLRSPTAPTSPLPEPEAGQFMDADWNGSRWRFYTDLDLHTDTRVVVGQNLEVRERFVRSIAWHSLLPFLFVLPLLLWLLLTLRHALHPLVQLARDLSRRTPGHLAPLALVNPPLELRPVQAALNGLFERANAARETERRFIADASHELRTPLAALRIQLQVAQRSADAAARQAAVDKSLIGVDDMTRLVQHLLSLARLESQWETKALETVALDGVATQVCAELSTEAAGRGVCVVLDTVSASVRGVPDLLQVLVRNLLTNSVRHNREGGEVHVSVWMDVAGQACLAVCDNGPGVPADKLASLGQHRFERLDESVADGFGIGLSIVQRIAELHGARVERTCPQGTGGLRTTLYFDAAKE